MSGDSFIVPPLSRKNIRAIAARVRKLNAALTGEDPACFPIVRFLDVTLPRALPDFVLEVAEVEEMGACHGMTYPAQNLIRVRRDVYEGAYRNQGRDRLTLAHELGHYVLHGNVGLARALADDNVATYRQSEWQANAFGGELLVSAAHLDGCRSVQEIMFKFGVSFDAASLQLRKFREEGIIR